MKIAGDSGSLVPKRHVVLKIHENPANSSWAILEAIGASYSLSLRIDLRSVREKHIVLCCQKKGPGVSTTCNPKSNLAWMALLASLLLESVRQQKIALRLGPWNATRYPLVNVYITMENHHFQWVNPLFQWQFSIAFC